MMNPEDLQAPGTDETASDHSTVEPTADNPSVELQSAGDDSTEDLENVSVDELTAQKQVLKTELDELSRQRDSLTQELETKQAAVQTALEDGLVIFKQRQAELQRNVEQLERRREAIRKEMRENFVGTSQDLALRVQGFKDYLVGSLQDLASAADKLELVRDNRQFQPSPQDNPETGQSGEKQALPLPEFAQKTDVEQEQQIRDLLARYRTTPDYYGPPWQLRRTFEGVHEDAISKWFFDQGGRGALRTLGSRLQNILVASAAISVLNEFYGDRVCALVLANSPERLGDWRRGLQECLGVSRVDFGPNQGIVLCESPEVLAQRAERMLQVGDLPLVILDESELLVDVALLRFPLWIAFAPDPAKPRPSYDEPFGPERQDSKSGGGLFEGPDNLFERAFGSLGLGREEDPRYGGGYPGRDEYGGRDRYTQPSYGEPGYVQGGYNAQQDYGQQQSYSPQGGYGQDSYGQQRYAQGTGYEQQPGSDAGGYGAPNQAGYDQEPYGTSSSPGGDRAYGQQQGWNERNDGYGQPRNDVAGQDGNNYGGGDDYGTRREPRRSRYSEGEQSGRYRDRDDNSDDWL